MSETARLPHHAHTAMSNPRHNSAVPQKRKCRLEIAGHTSVGMVRERNEDSYFVQHISWSNRNNPQELALLVVADGMGGHDAGDEASGLTIQSVAASLAPLIGNILNGKFTNLPDAALLRWVEGALKDANQIVRDRFLSNPARKRMACTASVVLIWNDRVFISHAGDCRVYLYHENKLCQITEDHTVVGRMLRLGQISPNEARNHPQSSEVTHGVGVRNTLDGATYSARLHPGDWLLISCDGLYSQVAENTIMGTLKTPPPSAFELANTLVNCADQAGGEDNCTVVAVKCS